MLNLTFAAALAGAIITFAALWPYGTGVAIIGAPFGASLLALAVTVFYTHKPKQRKSSHNAIKSVPFGSSSKHPVDQ